MHPRVRANPVPSFRSYRPKTLNNFLVDSVQREKFATAEQLLLQLTSESIPIEPNPAYERAALAQIRWHGSQDLAGFLKWLALVPDNEKPSRVENGPLTKTREMLFRTGTPARNLHIIKEFSLACAAKGYGQLVWDDLVRLMSGFEYAENAIPFFLAFEAAVLRYYAKYHPGFVEETASRQRYRLIMLCCDNGWLEQAVHLVEDSTAHRIRKACDRLIDLLRAHNDSERIALVEGCLAQKRSAPIPAAQAALQSPEKLSPTQRIGNLFGRPTQTPQTAHATAPMPFYSTRAIIEGSKTLRPRNWIASQLRAIKRALSQRSLVFRRPPGSNLHSFMAHYDACKGYPRGLTVLRKRALSASDPCSYTWLCKEMFYLHESRKFAEVVNLFNANFRVEFLPPKPWAGVLGDRAAGHGDELRTASVVPARLQISPADAWVAWNALVRLTVQGPAPLPVLEAVHHSLVHFASKITDVQFRAFPTSYTAVFRSLIWAYGELREVDRAVAVANDISLIGKAHVTNAGLLDELAGVYARTGDVPAATRLLNGLEEAGARLATYGVMMDAYLHVGLVEEAAKLEPRMKQKCGYVPGVNWRMDATLKALHAAQELTDVPTLT
ncbi:hypothetical protein B0H15DRAFT_512944 [Mycena belliarum]|uniref:Pentatricopeptide repeat-containing protein n=1 Tax=Mycena belliarum TaxID=1033014 RepID=A0AAD6UF60_9AGAR|nr:hypothetical protein B0H15DRAFT_512944 [Mycena belliae]